jgi:hypothetical protein
MTSPRAFGIDFHVWANYKGKLQSLADQGMVFAFFKVTMGYGDAPEADIADFFNEVSKTTIIPGVYGWIDPTGLTSDQINRFARIINTYKPKIVADDFEQSWSDWTKYYQFLNGTITWSQVPKVSPFILSSFGFAYCAGIESAKGNAKHVIYTNQGFVGDYAPSAVGWLGGYNLWDAGSSYYDTPNKFTTWPALHTWVESRPTQNSSISVMKSRARQISSQVWMPGFTGQYDNVDFDLWINPDGTYATVDQMRAEFSVTPPVVLSLESLDARVKVLEKKAGII